MGIKDWFGNAKHKAHKAGPHTGTGYSGTMGAQPKAKFRTADGKAIKPAKNKRTK